LGPQEVFEYVDVWRKLHAITLTPEPDRIIWRWTSNGVYSASSCYKALFHGSTSSPCWRLLWKNWAPMNNKIFLWLASLDRCWTAERRARHGLTQDTACILYSQETESIDHLLSGCVFSRITWHEIMSWCRLTTPPMDSDTVFFTWWSKVVDESPCCLRKGLNSIVALTAWSIWKHRNAAIFENRRPSTEDLILSIKDDARLWAKAGARGLAAIIPVT
uniref:Reverse transcriptase zinc-binding domain-containing protein n=1 Tax=Aegilops tauschii subsp. strangulata TaxID=200361 RepID=A0A453HE53_AEGTS